MDGWQQCNLLLKQLITYLIKKCLNIFNEVETKNHVFFRNQGSKVGLRENSWSLHFIESRDKELNRTRGKFQIPRLPEWGFAFALIYLFSCVRNFKSLHLKENYLEGKFSIDLPSLNYMHGGAKLVSQNVMLHTMYEMRRPSFGMC